MGVIFLGSYPTGDSITDPLVVDLRIRRGTTRSKAWLFRLKADQAPFIDDT